PGHLLLAGRLAGGAGCRDPRADRLPGGARVRRHSLPGTDRRCRPAGGGATAPGLAGAGAARACRSPTARGLAHLGRLLAVPRPLARRPRPIRPWSARAIRAAPLVTERPDRDRRRTALSDGNA